MRGLKLTGLANHRNFDEELAATTEYMAAPPVETSMIDVLRAPMTGGVIELDFADGGIEVWWISTLASSTSG